jgi:phage-related baseplate assembly protein
VAARILASMAVASNFPIVKLSLPTPQALETLDYEALFQAWLAAFTEAAPWYDVGNLQTDPGVVIAQAMTYMRLDDRARVNDVYTALRLALAVGTDLDGLAADRGVRRLLWRPADPILGTPDVWEDDDSLRLRSFLRMQTWGVGTPLGLEFYARTVGLSDLADARVFDYPGEGRQDLVILPQRGLDPDVVTAMVGRIGAAVMERHRRPGAVYTDTIEATIDTLDVSGVLLVRRGASPDAVRTIATASLKNYLATRRRVGAIVPISAVYAAAHAADVVAIEGLTLSLNGVALQPKTDAVIESRNAPEVGTITFVSETADA